jgi:hypothetical protein
VFFACDNPKRASRVANCSPVNVRGAESRKSCHSVGPQLAVCAASGIVPLNFASASSRAECARGASWGMPGCSSHAVAFTFASRPGAFASKCAMKSSVFAAPKRCFCSQDCSTTSNASRPAAASSARKKR